MQHDKEFGWFTKYLTGCGKNAGVEIKRVVLLRPNVNCDRGFQAPC